MSRAVFVHKHLLGLMCNLKLQQFHLAPKDFLNLRLAPVIEKIAPFGKLT